MVVLACGEVAVDGLSCSRCWWWCSLDRPSRRSGFGNRESTVAPIGAGAHDHSQVLVNELIEGATVSCQV